MTGFIEKGEQRQGRFLINSGIYVVESRLVAPLPEGVPLNFGQDVLPQAIRAGAAIVAHRLTRPVVDIGTSAGLARARALVG